MMRKMECYQNLYSENIMEEEDIDIYSSPQENYLRVINTIEEIEQAWEQDSNIDRTDISNEILQIIIKALVN